MSYLRQKLQVLLWKNWVIRKRSWFLSLVEIVIPILLFFVIAWVRKNNVVPPKVEPESIYEERSEATIDEYSFIHQETVHLGFAPNTATARQIIAEFNNTLLKVIKKLESFNTFESELKLEQFFQQKFENSSSYTNVIGYGIVFEDVHGPNIPKNFKYKIRSTFPYWNTALLFPQVMPGGPKDETIPYIEKGFLAIQMAVDNAYIKVAQKAKTSPIYITSVQQMPFPSYINDSFNEMFQFIMPIITLLSFITISISVLKKVVEEKVSGVMELMKMMGLKTWMVWGGWVMNGMMVYLTTCAIITFLLCHAFDPDKGAVIAYVNFTVVFAMYIVFCLASIFFCFAISSFFMKPTIAMTVGMVLWMLSLTALFQYIGQVGLPLFILILLSLVPLYNICTGYMIIASFESREVNLSWLNLFSGVDGGTTTSMGFVFIMFFAQMLVYFVITWYVSAIHPGPYGRAEPWYFIFTFYKKPNGKKKGMLDNFDDKEEQCYETPPTDLKIGLQIHNLRKVFNQNFVAVDKVNLDIYENQITALLGHNGAGKTTTMSVLTGMYSPTAGTVYTRDYNIFENMDRFRCSLGLCPQHDLLFPYLTPMEHLIFFGMLKGMTMSAAQSDGQNLLNMVRMSEKKNVLAEKLSGGMKRKVSLAIALIGTPQVLVLDEPTSGMDPESRREMWDLLLKLRSERRTILITTHFMEEADVLGDRIAIMDHGIVKCYGTSLYLKRLYGTGYQLTMAKSTESPVQPITDTITTSVTGAQLKTVHPTQVSYMVPQEEASNLSSMFEAIEAKKAALGITSVGISCTTMEDVFLKVGQKCKEEKEEFDKTSAHFKDPQNNLIRNTSQEALTYKKVSGFRLVLQQFLSLLHKRSLFSIRRPVASIIFFGLPLLLMWTTISKGTVNTSATVDPPLDLSLSIYGDTESYVGGPPLDQKAFKQIVVNHGSNIESVPSDIDIIQFLLGEAKHSLGRYKTRVIAAANFNTSSMSATAMFNGLAYHSLPVSVNLISNALLQRDSKTEGYSIATVNHPLDLNNVPGTCVKMNEITQGLTAFMWLVLVPVGLKGFLLDLITFPHTERTTNAKQLQLMTGVAPLTYWLACFLWDYFLYLASTTAVMIIVIISDRSHLFTSVMDYGVLLLILVLFGVSGISSTYLFSFVAKTSTTAGSLYTIFTLITGTIAPIVMYFARMLKDAHVLDSVLVTPIHYLLCLEPQYALGTAIINFSYLLTQRSACKTCDINEIKEKMCSDIDQKSYLAFTSNTNPNGILVYILFLAFDWVLYLLVIVLIEYGYMRKLSHWLKVLWVGKSFDKLLDAEDSDVRDERDKVDAARGVRDIATVLTVDGLAKKFSRNFAAVQGVSFRVSGGECFGLLGVNGAGKTTTFRMLTGDESPTAGSASIQNYDLVKDRTKFLAQIGYCPQFDGINGFLTGEEVLRLFATLRGIPKHSMQSQIDEWINVLGLSEYRHRRCGKYSGGNKRKLSTAMALVGDPPVVFLDEPTTGVDPVARRNLWDVLGRCQRSGQAIVLTSHSMEECEALCSRLTIMVRGRMKCIGSNQYLKQRYGQGYTIMVKLNPQFIVQEKVEALKIAIGNKFVSCTLKDEHQSLLHYHLTDTNIPLSQLFRNMEELKNAHSMIEDYIVSDTTLEQVFIAFAREGTPTINAVGVASN